jgi:general secretion pathway protein A
MYETFYGMTEKPFDIRPNPEFLFLSKKYETALTFLEYGLMDNIGAMLLTGGVGTGKTTLIHYVLRHFCDNLVPVLITNTNLTPDQLVEAVLHALDLPHKRNSKAVNLDSLNRYLREQIAAGKRVLLIIDEAQNLSVDTLEEVRMLSNLQDSSQMLLQVMLVGQPELRARLKRPEFAQFAQRIAVNFNLEALSREETAGYVAFRLRKAGGNEALFEAAALDRIHAAARGIPRNINQICDAALVYGFAYEMAAIGPQVIDQVLVDKDNIGLETETPAAPTLSGEPVAGAGFDQRLTRLETEFDTLKTDSRRQLSELAVKLDGVRKALADALSRLYQFERKRNDALLRKVRELENENRALREQLAERQG